MSLWISLATSILKKSHLISPNVFKTFFKLSPRLTEVVWKRLFRSKLRICSLVKPQHLLWTLHFLKSQNPLHEEIAAVLGICKKTMILHVTRTLRALRKTCPKVIIFFSSIDLQSFPNFHTILSHIC